MNLGTTYNEMLSDVSTLKSFHIHKWRSGLEHYFRVNEIIDQRQPVRLLDTNRDINSREKYVTPARFGFQINVPSL